MILRLAALVAAADSTLVISGSKLHTFYGGGGDLAGSSSWLVAVVARCAVGYHL